MQTLTIKIDNPYEIDQCLEVQDTQTHQWITGTVIDKKIIGLLHILMDGQANMIKKTDAIAK